MRSLAIARYRLLSGIRSSDWVFAVALFWALLPFAVSTGLHMPASESQVQSLYRNVQMPSMVIVIYMIHLLVLIVAADVVGASTRKRIDKAEAADLLDMVPIDRGSRFLGDAAGIAATIAVVHIATMPFLFLAAAVSPLEVGAVLWMEASIFALIVFFAFLAGSKGRDFTTAWGRSRPFRTLMTVVVLLVAWIAVTGSLPAFRDALGAIILDPSPRKWAALTATVHNPLLLAALTAATFGGSIAYWYMHAVRPERSR